MRTGVWAELYKVLRDLNAATVREADSTAGNLELKSVRLSIALVEGCNDNDIVRMNVLFYLCQNWLYFRFRRSGYGEMKLGNKLARPRIIWKTLDAIWSRACDAKPVDDKSIWGSILEAPIILL